jgi:replicative DNA helicase
MILQEKQKYDSDVDNLAKYGSSFQTKAIAAILQTPDFLAQYIDVVNPNYFEAEGHRWIVTKTLDYFTTYKKLPPLEFFKAELVEEENETLRVDVVGQLRNVFERIKDSDLDYVKDRLLDFGKTQTLKTAILRSVDYLNSGDYDGIKSIVDRAMRAGQPKNIGHDWKKDVHVRLSKLARNVVPTGFKPIDELMNGGLAGGELGVIVAPSGIGKSWGLSAIGANALKIGKNVIHYTLELNESYVGIRYDTIFSGIEPAKIPDNPAVVEKITQQIQGEIIIKFYPAKSITVHAISAHVQQLNALGFYPDVIIVDYADLLRSTEKADARYQELGAIYEQLRCLAGELNVPIWTASQSQRSSIQDDVIQADKIAESYSKVMTADFLMSMSRKLEDKVNNTGRVHIMKNRFGPDGMTFPMIMNPAKGILEIYDENSSQGILLRKQMQAGEADVKRDLAKRFRQMEDNFLDDE